MTGLRRVTDGQLRACSSFRQKAVWKKMKSLVLLIPTKNHFGVRKMVSLSLVKFLRSLLHTIVPEQNAISELHVSPQPYCSKLMYIISNDPGEVSTEVSLVVRRQKWKQLEVCGEEITRTCTPEF